MSVSEQVHGRLLELTPQPADVSSRAYSARSFRRGGLTAQLLGLAVSALGGVWAVRQLAPTVSDAVAWRASVLVTAAGLGAVVVGSSSSRRAHRLTPSLLTSARLMGSAVAVAVVLALAVSPLLAHGEELVQLEGVVAIAAGPLLAVLPLAHWLSSRGGVAEPHRVAIVGSGQVAEALAGRLKRMPHVHVVATVDDCDDGGDEGQIAQLGALCRSRNVDHVIVAYSRTPSHRQLGALRGLPPGVALSVVPRMYELVSWQSGLEDLNGLPLLHVARPRATASARAGKRVLDVTVASLALLLFAPVLCVVAVAIKLESPGPVLFRQARTGRQGRPFQIMKFRTMCVGAEQARADLQRFNESDGPIFKIQRDPRVTRVGRWLRRSSLDELPQLINVLRGEMSLVGPRPFPVDEAAELSDWVVSRTAMAPGITGLWQICGRNDLSYDDLHALDSLYVSSWCMSWDLRILLQTPARVLRRSGAY